MNYIISDSIISPLARSTQEHLQAVLEGRSALYRYAGRFADVEPFVGSLFQHISVIEGFTSFESLCIEAVREAARQILEVLQRKDTVFILSSTKGNIECLETGDEERTLLWSSAKRIAGFFGNDTPPVVVSNACISGVSALITAQRLLERRMYSYAVVVGCDVLSKFIVSGFQSFKALSDEVCRPYDSERKGLNLGEAAACMVLTNEAELSSFSYGTIEAGAIHNDANHISGPSRTGEGSYRCLTDVKASDIAFVNLHGTATAYNDEMESVAVMRAGMQSVPVNGLKGYFGHSLGAAGLAETILSLHALRQGIVLPTKGFGNQGTTNTLNVSSQLRHSGNRRFIKLLSGFGGCNAAIRVSDSVMASVRTTKEEPSVCTQAEIHITPDTVTINGKPFYTAEHPDKMLTELYRRYINDYPKFFKMDTLSRLGFVASELLLGTLEEERFVQREDRAVVFANRSASLNNDRNYQQTIQQGNYFPSPALFVYTLPNIVTGEIAIRNKYLGETAFYVLDNEIQFWPLVNLAFCCSATHSVLAGWVECSRHNAYEAHIRLIVRQTDAAENCQTVSAKIG